MPEGSRCSAYFSSPMTTVWPALLPPLNLTTQSVRSPSRSVALPLPSSPHWTPTITMAGIFTPRGIRRYTPSYPGARGNPAGLRPAPGPIPPDAGADRVSECCALAPGLWSWSVLRLAMAAAIVAAIGAQLVQTVSGAIANGSRRPHDGGELLQLLHDPLERAAPRSRWRSAPSGTCAGAATKPPSRGGSPSCSRAVTTYMVVTGIVYNTLLRGVALEPGAIVPWSNEMLHLIGPLFLLADLFLGPKRRALPWRTVLGIVIFPLVWVAYTLLRARFIVNPGNGRPCTGIRIRSSIRTAPAAGDRSCSTSSSSRWRSSPWPRSWCGSAVVAERSRSVVPDSRFPRSFVGCPQLLCPPFGLLPCLRCQCFSPIVRAATTYVSWG